eukprot:jgi/Hompol1/2533/HPOL_006038-RA
MLLEHEAASAGQRLDSFVEACLSVDASTVSKPNDLLQLLTAATKFFADTVQTLSTNADLDPISREAQITSFVDMIESMATDVSVISGPRSSSQQPMPMDIEATTTDTKVSEHASSKSELPSTLALFQSSIHSTQTSVTSNHNAIADAAADYNDDHTSSQPQQQRTPTVRIPGTPTPVSASKPSSGVTVDGSLAKTPRQERVHAPRFEAAGDLAAERALYDTLNDDNMSQAIAQSANWESPIMRSQDVAAALFMPESPSAYSGVTATAARDIIDSEAQIIADAASRLVTEHRQRQLAWNAERIAFENRLKYAKAHLDQSNADMALLQDRIAQLESKAAEYIDEKTVLIQRIEQLKAYASCDHMRANDAIMHLKKDLASVRDDVKSTKEQFGTALMSATLDLTCATESILDSIGRRLSTSEANQIRALTESLSRSETQLAQTLQQLESVSKERDATADLLLGLRVSLKAIESKFAERQTELSQQFQSEQTHRIELQLLEQALRQEIANGESQCKLLEERIAEVTSRAREAEERADAAMQREQFAL